MARLPEDAHVTLRNEPQIDRAGAVECRRGSIQRVLAAVSNDNARHPPLQQLPKERRTELAKPMHDHVLAVQRALTVVRQRTFHSTAAPPPRPQGCQGGHVSLWGGRSLAWR